MMNLEDGERAHPPVFPTEAIYEKLLESRHEFDSDYERVVANGETYLIRKADADEIRKMAYGDGPLPWEQKPENVKKELEQDKKKKKKMVDTGDDKGDEDAECGGTKMKPASANPFLKASSEKKKLTAETV